MDFKITLATKITIMRIIVVPFIIISIIRQDWGMALGLTIFAGLSDILDGKLARIRNEKSLLGSVLDPLADKFLILSCYYTLSVYEKGYFIIPKWFFLLVLLKELILILSAGLFLNKNYVKIEPVNSGKAAMMSQTFLLNIIFLLNYLKLYLVNIYFALFCFSLFLVLLSLYQYAKIGIKQLILYKV